MRNEAEDEEPAAGEGELAPSLVEAEHRALESSEDAVLGRP